MAGMKFILSLLLIFTTTQSFRANNTSPNLLKTTLGDLTLCIGEDCTVDRGCKRVVFIRHAEGYHQVANHHVKTSSSTKDALAMAKNTMDESDFKEYKRKLENWAVYADNPDAGQYIDAELTMTGRQQCLAAVAPLVDTVIVSPLRRTLETAYLIFGAAEDKRQMPTFVVQDLCRERYGQLTCDKRKPMSNNRAWKPRGYATDAALWSKWDWTLQTHSPPMAARPEGMQYEDEDTVWTPTRETPTHVRQRALTLLEWILTSDQEHAAVVTHSSFMRHMFDTSAVPDNAVPMPTVVCPAEKIVLTKL